MMKVDITAFFERYQTAFNEALGGDADFDELASLYATDVIAASPAGVMAARNDDEFRRSFAQGYERYRALGTKAMRVRKVASSPIDEHHCLAHVAWTAIYSRRHREDVAIDFDVHYFLQEIDGEAKVFGWVSADEQTLLKKHGIV